MAAVRVKLVNLQLLQEQVAQWQEQGEIPSDALTEENPLGWLVHGEVDSVISAGYKFAADHPGISTVLTGTSNLHHFEDNLKALENPTLPEADKQKLTDLFGDIAIYI